MFEFMNKVLPKQPKELYNGNREYKIYLDVDDEVMIPNRILKKDSEYVKKLKENKRNNKINKRASQLKFRLDEGCGKCLYLIGIRDNGENEGIEVERLFSSISYLYKMINIINANIKSIKIYKSANENKYICTARIINPNHKHNFYTQL